MPKKCFRLLIYVVGYIFGYMICEGSHYIKHILSVSLCSANTKERCTSTIYILLEVYYAIGYTVINMINI